MERPPEYREAEPQLDYYAPRVRDFQPDVPARTSPNSEADAESILPSYDTAAQVNRRYYGLYKSEDEYLEALRAFVQEKEFVDGAVDRNGNPIGLIGFYGHKTGADYAKGSGRGDERKRKQKRNTHAEGDNVTQDETLGSKAKAGFWQRRLKDRSSTKSS